MKNIIEFNSVDIYRGDEKVLQNISFSISGHTAIIGCNGAGKSTILKAIYKEIYPVKKIDSYVRILGEENWDLFELRSKIGVISSEEERLARLNIPVREYIMSGFFGQLGITSYNQITCEMKDKVNNIANFLSIETLLSREVRSLSTGQTKRCQIARAMIHNPDTYILDEPSSGLDIGAQKILMSSLAALMERGKNIVLVTHHISEILPDIKRVIGIKHGKIIFDGHRDDVLTKDNLSLLFDTNLEIFKKNGIIYAY